MDENEQKLIGNCGINCGLCTAYLAYSHNIPKQKGVQYCTGCRVRNKNCAFIKKACPSKLGKNITFCFECTTFPCERLKRVDARYQRDYNTSPIKNLEYLRDHGIESFIKAQHEEHRCPKCGSMLCVHNGFCYDCGKDVLLQFVAAKKTTVRKQQHR